MLTRGLIKSTRNVTRTEGSGEDREEVNYCVVTVEIPLDSLNGDDLAFLARQLNQIVTIDISTTIRPLREIRAGQTSMADALEEQPLGEPEPTVEGAPDSFEQDEQDVDYMPVTEPTPALSDVLQPGDHIIMQEDCQMPGIAYKPSEVTAITPDRQRFTVRGGSSIGRQTLNERYRLATSDDMVGSHPAGAAA